MVYRCAIIGLGRIGCGFDDNLAKNQINTHAGAYQVNKKTKLVALCDIDKLKLKKYGKKFKIKKLYSDYNEMLKNEKLDCVSICTLADSHYDIIKIATKYVNGIFLEKPMTNSINQASQIIKLSKKNHLKIQIDHQRRFSTFYQKIRDFIKNKSLGKIQHVNIYYGSGILNTGIHVFDLINFFFDKVQKVEGWKGMNYPNNKKDPNIDGFIICKNNIKCNLISLDVSNYRIFEMDIIGSKGRLKIDMGSNTAELYIIDDSHKGLVFNELRPKSFPNTDHTPQIVSGLNDLLQSIENDENPLCDVKSGYSALEISLALIESAKKNKVVSLPLKQKIFMV
jgi:predicted dehydrogenase